MGIVVIGAVFVDIKGYPFSTYIPGGRNAGRVEQVHGGVSRNVAEDIANVELRPTFVSLVDDTGIGQDVINKLKAHKVNTKYIRTVPDGMGTWLAVFDNDGDVCAAISKRPDTSPLTRLLEEKGETPLSEIMKPLHFVLESQTLDKLLKELLHSRSHLFAVLDEYGGLAGVVTLEDVFEEMLGSEIMDESDSVADLRQMARQRRQALRAAGLLEQQKKEEQAEQSRS